MHARSALFDVYGDLLTDREHRATVGALIQLLEPVGIAAPAVRTAISRMVAQGWLRPVSLPAGRGYAATDRAVVRLAAAAHRVYRRPVVWDGSWHLLVLGSGSAGDGSPRTVRSRVHRQLRYLGYAPLRDQVWISPHRNPEVEEVLAQHGLPGTTAVCRDFDPPHAPTRAWDIDAVDRAYASWTREARSRLAADLAVTEDHDRAAYAARFHLVHEWRKFLFLDPRLPAELLPEDWSGHSAEELFVREAARLKEPSDRFVARVLGPLPPAS